MAKEFSVHNSNIGIYVDGELKNLDEIVVLLRSYEAALENLATKLEPAYYLAGQFKAHLEIHQAATDILRNKIKELEITCLDIKGSASETNAQQPHGGQSVSQPAPNCLSATSPC